MAALSEYTSKLAIGQDLTSDEIKLAVGLLSQTGEADEAKAAFLIALADKGESAAELAGFAEGFRALAVDPGVGAWSTQAIDIVGTGGDHAGGFNISSVVVLVLAAAGVPVMKHGNRGITSKCGSADLLSALGVNLQATPEQSRLALAELGYAFFFAPNYHPAFKAIGPVRKLLAAQGRRSIFNVLGPLVNPGRPGHILLGVYSQPLVSKMAAALEHLGQDAGVVGHGIIDSNRGIDELTTATVNQIHGVGRLRDWRTELRAADAGLPPADFGDLVGGDVGANLATVDAVLKGTGPRGLVDTILLNAAVGLHAVGRTTSLPEGVAMAREYLLGGAVAGKIAATREFYHSL